MFHGPWSRMLVCAVALAVVGPLAATMDGQERRDPMDRPDASRKPDATQKQEPAKADSETKPNPVAKPDFARYQARGNGSMPLIHDWSTRHVIYTGGYTAEQAERMAKDPRAYAAFLAHGMEHRHHEPKEHHPEAERGTLKRDWAVPLGGPALGGLSFPAKYTFDVNAPPSCTDDFVVFPVLADTGSSRANVVGTFASDPMIGQTASIIITPAGSSPVTLTLTAGTTNSGTTFAVSGTNNPSTNAVNFAAAINRNLSSIGLDELVAIPSTGTLGPVTVSALTAGTGVTLSTTNNLSNFSWAPAAAGANGSQANIVGLNNLYTGSGAPLCAGYTYPTYIFSYAAGIGSVGTSPVLSLDGRRIAFVENDPALGSILHVLTLGTNAEYGSCRNSGTSVPTCNAAAVIPGSTPGSNASDYMVPLGALSGGLVRSSDYESSPFVDYSTDVLYVGDNNGYLYSVSAVFGGGTPALRSGFPVLLSSIGDDLASPVVDVANTGNIFINDAESNLFNVRSDGVIQGSLALGYSNILNYDGPDVDSTNAVGYVATQCNSTASGYTAVVQFSITAVGSPSLLASANLSAPDCASRSGTPTMTLDNNYFTKGISSDTPGNNGELLVAYENPNSLAQFQFTSGLMNTTPQYTDTDNGGFNSGAAFSSLTEFYGNDQAYTIGTVTQNGDTVTVTTTANAFVSNQVVVMSGVAGGTGGCTSAAASAISGEQTITVINPTTFTFTSGATATIGGSNGSCTLTNALATGPTQDYLFFELSANAEIFAYNLPLLSTTQAPTATNTTSAGNGTGGFTIDNDSSDGQASSIYFGMVNSDQDICGRAYYCAVKLTQVGLN
jgi:hypothetical protein